MAERLTPEGGRSSRGASRRSDERHPGQSFLSSSAMVPLRSSQLPQPERSGVPFVRHMNPGLILKAAQKDELSEVTSLTLRFRCDWEKITVSVETGMQPPPRDHGLAYTVGHVARRGALVSRRRVLCSTAPLTRCAPVSPGRAAH